MIEPPDPPGPDSPLIRDPLTGAYARALLDDRLAEELHRARRYGERFALCVLDIDYFKSVNDAYGHLRGDQILRQLVQRLLGLVRAADALFRYGGDEFVLLLPNTPREQALALAERLLQAVRQAPFGGDPPLSLSLSAGIAHFPADGADAGELFAVADARHYEAKRQGRSRIIVAEPGQPAPPAAETLAPPLLPDNDGSLAQLAPVRDAGPRAALDAPLAGLIGRGRELRKIEGLLRKSRLVTLLGPAGIGKTRLALEIGRRLRGDYAHGACFVPLAAVSEPAHAAPAIAAALGVGAGPGAPPLDRLKEALAGRELLLILDHFEQIVAGAPLVTELLAAAPRLAILVTSGDVLHVYGEHVFPLPALEAPPADSPAPGEYPAAALFAERARAASPGFALGGANAAGVCALCRAVDGLPLALELAAARAGQLAPAQIAGQIADQLERLAGEPPGPDVPPALRAALDWSLALLGAEERRAWSRLAVFAGGCPAAAVRAVCLPDAEDESMARSVLQSLADHGLARRSLAGDPGAAPRFELPGPLRTRALALLDESGELAEAERRHAAWYAALAGRADAELDGDRLAQWAALLESEQPNLRAALGWSLQAGAEEPALELANALTRFWSLRGDPAEGFGWLEAALERFPDAPEAPAGRRAARAQALQGAGLLAEQQGDHRLAHARYQAALELRRALGDRRGAAAALGDLGGAAAALGQHQRARDLFSESLALWLELGDRRGQAETLERIAGALADRGLAVRSARLFAAAAAAREEDGGPPRRARIDGRLALLRARLSDETWESAWAAGRALPREQAMAEALDDGDLDR